MGCSEDSQLRAEMRRRGESRCVDAGAPCERENAYGDEFRHAYRRGALPREGDAGPGAQD